MPGRWTGGTGFDACAFPALFIRCCRAVLLPDHRSLAVLDRWLAGHHTLATVLAEYYDNAHWGFTLALLGWVWWKRADLYRPLRNSLVIVARLGLCASG